MNLPAPRLVVALMGIPGAGKSTIARGLERELGLRRVCRDTIRRAMFPTSNYSRMEKRAAFRAVLLALEINCLLDASSVLDGMTFSRRKDFDAVAELAGRLGFSVLPLLVECRPALARQRIEADMVHGVHPSGDRRPALVDAVVSRFQALPAGTIRIDGESAIDVMCAQARASVSAWCASLPKSSVEVQAASDAMRSAVANLHEGDGED